MIYLNISAFLQTPIEELPTLSKAFVKRCHSCGFTCLHDMVTLGAQELSKSKYLGASHFRELVDYLYEKELLLVLPN